MRFDASPLFLERIGVRVAARLGMSFFLQHLQIVRDQRPLVDGLILLALFQFNYGRLNEEQARDLAGGGAESGPTAASVNALAQSLKLPFETVRQRVAVLRSDGLCERHKGSLLITPAQLQTERFQWQAQAIWSEVRRLYFGLADLGVLRPVAAAPVRDSPPLFDVLRLASEYTLRQVEAMTDQVANPALGILIINILRATTEHLDDTYTEVSETDDLVRDELRRPASVPMLASRCGLTVETARRHISTLVDQGWVVRAPGGGVMVTRDMLRGPPWPEARRQNVANLNRLVEGLDAVGALAFWVR
jgi:DNA-binding transcriptional regulator YhcF (GntR family)